MAGKRRRRKMETPYARITEIREASTSDEANKLLNGGFVLIKAVERRETDALGRQASSIIYVLRRLRPSGNGGQTKANNPTDTANPRQTPRTSAQPTSKGDPGKPHPRG